MEELCPLHEMRWRPSIFGWEILRLRLLSFLLTNLCIVALQVNYGNFMHGLMKENIQLNRKVLSELSMHEPYSFKALVDISRTAFPGNKNVVHAPKKEGLSMLV